jgi:hypothetical protein
MASCSSYLRAAFIKNIAKKNNIVVYFETEIKNKITYKYKAYNKIQQFLR